MTSHVCFKQKFTLQGGKGAREGRHPNAPRDVTNLKRKLIKMLAGNAQRERETGRETERERGETYIKLICNILL